MDTEARLSDPSSPRPGQRLPAEAVAACAEQALLLSETEEQRCRDYRRVKLVLRLLEAFTLPTTLATLTLSGAARHLLEITAVSRASPWVDHLLFLLVAGLIVRLTLLPIHFFDEYHVERRFGLGRQSAASWLAEWLFRSTLYGLALVLFLFPVLETLRWGLLLALPWGVLFLIGRTWFDDYVYHPLLKIFYPIRFLRFETFNLPGLGKTTLPVYQVQVSHKTRHANAGIRLRGRSPAIYVTDTLIDEFTDGEERVVMAHEFGHLYDRLHLEVRTPSGIAQAQRKLVLGGLQLLAGVLSLGVMHFLAPVLRLEGASDPAGFPLLMALTLVLAHSFSPHFCEAARRDERDADEYALAITGDVENYVSVMRKLRQINLEESCANPLSRFLLDTHPSCLERVDLAYRYRPRKNARRKPPHWRGWRHIQKHGRR